MVARETDFVAFGKPGGESSGISLHRPVDLEYLARQTMDDREVEREVLDLFVHQALSIRDAIRSVDIAERLMLAHGLKGAARGVGAFAVADCVAEIELHPEDPHLIDRLASLIDEVRDFIASINR